MEIRRRGIAVGALEGAIYAVGGLDDTTCFQVTEAASHTFTVDSLCRQSNDTMLT
jgi:hypothetical protein